jgi:hypothetical protein
LGHALLRKITPEGWQLISHTFQSSNGSQGEEDGKEISHHEKSPFNEAVLRDVVHLTAPQQLISTTFYGKDPATDTGVVESISTTVERQRSLFHESVLRDITPEGWQRISTTCHAKDDAADTDVVEGISTMVERKQSPFIAG